MNLPTIDRYCDGKPNAVGFTLYSPAGDTLRIWYSYQTPVGFALNGKRTVRENEWGPTTGKHLNTIDGGGSDAKAARVGLVQFERALAEALAQFNGAKPDPLTELGRECARELGERGQSTAGFGEHVPGKGRDGMARDGFKALGKYAREKGLV